MTREEKVEWLRSLPTESISPAQLAVIDGGSPYSYNIAAKSGNLNLPHFWRGRNLRIWKGPILAMIAGEQKDPPVLQH